MSYVSRESWAKDYMRLMDDEYGDYGFCDDPVPSYEEFADDWDSSEEIDTGWPSYVGVKSMDIDDDEECAVPRKVTKIREIKVPEGIRKSKRDVWMESLRRLEQAARTTTDFRNLSGWYDYLEDLEKDRARKHEIFRNGDDYPIEYGENENSTLFSGGLGNVISRQMRKGDLLDYLYCKPDTLHELVTTDYMIHFMKAIDKDERELFYYKVLEDLSNKEVAEMRGHTDRAIRKAWDKLLFHLKQRTMGVLIFRSDKNYSYTGDEQRFLDTCREEYEFKIESASDSC